RSRILRTRCSTRSSRLPTQSYARLALRPGSCKPAWTRCLASCCRVNPDGRVALVEESVDEWADLTLGDVLTLQRGFDLPGRLRKPGPYPIVSSSGVTGFHSEFKVEPPGVVIGRYGSLGSVHWVTEAFWPLN